MAFQRLEDDIQKLQNRTGALERGPRGTAAMRDAHYGVPTTNAERLALAGARWFDTTLGVWFTYFVNYTIPGAPAGLKRDPGGWSMDDVSMPTVMLDLQANTSVPTGSTLLAWRTTAPIYDAFGMYSLSTPTRILTAPWAGLWRVSYSVKLNSATGLTVNIKRNGSNYARSNASGAGGTGGNTTVQSNAPVYMSAGQYLELEVTPQAAAQVAGAWTFVEVTYMGQEAKL